MHFLVIFLKMNHQCLVMNNLKNSTVSVYWSFAAEWKSEGLEDILFALPSGDAKFGLCHD